MTGKGRQSKRLAAFSFLIVLALACSGCGAEAVDSTSPEPTEEGSTVSSDAESRPAGDTSGGIAEAGTDVSYFQKAENREGNIKDYDPLYADEDDDSVITMHLTVSSGNAADGSNHTWKEVNTYSAYDYEDMGVDRYQVEGILNIDDGDSVPENNFGYGAEVPNVSVQIRGQSSSRYVQKNYKIRIKKGMGEYEGQRTLDLNKHMVAPHRFNNKLGYDLLEDIPQLLSARTQFVHLYVTDTTAGGSGTEEDYGLYVMVEQINRTYLASHGLDQNGELYKVNFFEWQEYEAVMKNPEDEDYDRDAFEEYLEIKGKEDHTTLHTVLEELQNYQIPIQDIVEKHFNLENLMYWEAFQILTGNYDSGARNLFLYSPQNSERFYIICWDLDDSFQRSYNESINYSEGKSWESGMLQHLGIVLFNRMFKEEEYRKALDDAVTDLKEHYLTQERISQLTAGYTGVVEQYLFQMPDAANTLIDTPEAYEAAVKALPGEIQKNYERYLETQKCPWPFFVNLPVSDGTSMTLSWGNSYEVNGEPVTYDFILARDFAFTDIVSEGHGLAAPSVKTAALPEGKYYLKVTASNTSGYTADSFDYFVNSDTNGKVYGCYAFTVDKAGNIEYAAD